MKCIFDIEKECPVVPEQRSVFARLDPLQCVACQIKELNNLLKKYLVKEK